MVDVWVQFPNQYLDAIKKWHPMCLKTSLVIGRFRHWTGILIAFKMVFRQKKILLFKCFL